jgi:predicted ribonuclease YlaK
MLVVDAANVMGSRPDGWWRDRAGAAGRLLGEIEAALGAGRLAGPVTVVLEGAAKGAVRPGPSELRVVAAPGSGDDAIVAEVIRLVKEEKKVTVVTADRDLQTRVRRLGAGVESPGWLLDKSSL